MFGCVVLILLINKKLENKIQFSKLLNFEGWFNSIANHAKTKNNNKKLQKKQTLFMHYTVYSIQYLYIYYII